MHSFIGKKRASVRRRQKAAAAKHNNSKSPLPFTSFAIDFKKINGSIFMSQPTPNLLKRIILAFASPGGRFVRSIAARQSPLMKVQMFRHVLAFVRSWIKNMRLADHILFFVSITTRAGHLRTDNFHWIQSSTPDTAAVPAVSLDECVRGRTSTLDHPRGLRLFSNEDTESLDPNS
jgi:hypothetical protein